MITITLDKLYRKMRKEVILFINFPICNSDLGKLNLEVIYTKMFPRKIFEVNTLTWVIDGHFLGLDL